jgi:uncharacterized protein
MLPPGEPPTRGDTPPCVSAHLGQPFGTPVDRPSPLAACGPNATSQSYPPMKNDVVEVTVKGVMPTNNGCAVFLGNDEKNFVIYVDTGVGNAISMSLHGVKRDRPLTHDLMCSIFLGLGVTLERIVVNDVSDSTFFARIILAMANELGKKIIEVDARPSDSIALALQLKKPILVARSVFEGVEDMTEILERVLKQQQQQNENEETDET